MKLSCALGLVLVTAVACTTAQHVDETKRNPSSIEAPTGDLRLVGYVPARYFDSAYLKKSVDSKPHVLLALVEVKNGVIKSVLEIKEKAIAKLVKDDPRTLVLRRPGASDYDVIYPGMINLHNHTEQNMLPPWWEAGGVFNNRYEWRSYTPYKYAMKFNMDPWSNYGGDFETVKVAGVSAASYRWSELAAMVGGTTHLQGPSRYVENFAIHRVEDQGAYQVDENVKRKARVSAPLEVFSPDRSTMIVDYLYPLMVKMSGLPAGQIEDVVRAVPIETAMSELIKQWCPALASEKFDVTISQNTSVLKTAAGVRTACPLAPENAKLASFLPEIYLKSITNARRYFNSQTEEPSALILHIAEGRRDDPYTKFEFQILRMIGLVRPKVNLVHAVGLSESDYKLMAQNKMGLIWSPFSNYLLYGDTTDVRLALKSGVRLAIGSDWVPTGSRNVLNEIAFIRQLIQVDPRKEKLSQVLTDEVLYQAVTENPASMISQLESQEGDGYHGLGAIVKDATASFIVMSRNDKNPYTNFVKATEKDINWVVIDGRPIYGERSYFESHMKTDTTIDPDHLERMPESMASLAQLRNLHLPGIDAETVTQSTAESIYEHLKNLIRDPNVTSAFDSRERTNSCGFDSKVFFARPSADALVDDLKLKVGLDVDRYADIQKLLGLMLLTQSENAQNQNEAGRRWVPETLPALFACNDPSYMRKISNFIVGTGEIFKTSAGPKRQEIRDLAPTLTKTSQDLMNAYHLK